MKICNDNSYAQYALDIGGDFEGETSLKFHLHSNYNENAMTDDCSCIYDCFGDINLDNSIDIFDIIVIIEIILESVEPSDFESFVADFDQSGTIDVNDIISIIEFIL